MKERDKNGRPEASKNVLQPRVPAARPPASHVQAMMQAGVQPRIPAPVRQPAAHVVAAVGSRAVQPSPAVPPKPGGAVMRPSAPHVQAAMKPGASRPGTNVVQRVGWLIHGDSDTESETTILTGNWGRFGPGIGTKHVRNVGESIRKPDSATDFTSGVAADEAIHVEAHGNYSQLGDLNAYSFARGLVARFRTILTDDRKIILHACETGHNEDGYIYAKSVADHISTMTQKKAEVTVYAPIRKTITDMNGVTRVFKAGTRDDTIAGIDSYGKSKQARIEALTEDVGVGWVAFQVTKPKAKGAATVASVVVDAAALKAELVKLKST
jgi:hypothetical protein